MRFTCATRSFIVAPAVSQPRNTQASVTLPASSLLDEGLADEAMDQLTRKLESLEDPA